MKKLGKLSLKEMEQQMQVFSSDDQKNLFGGGEWVWMDGHYTYMLDEVTVSGTIGVPTTVEEVWRTAESYENLTSIGGAAGFFFAPCGVAALYTNQLEGVYEDFYHELVGCGNSPSDSLTCVSSMQVMSNGGIMEIEKYYLNGQLIKTLYIGR